MLKIIYISSFILIAIVSCQKENITGTFDYERDTPVCIKEKIDSISINREYAGTIVYRYEWKDNFIYHFMIPISSCAYCELYDQSCKKIQLTDETFMDFQENRENELIIWEWK